MFQKKITSAILIVLLMFFSFAPQTVHAGGVASFFSSVVDTVVDVVESVVETVVDVVQEVMSNPVLGIIAAVAVAYFAPWVFTTSVGGFSSSVVTANVIEGVGSATSLFGMGPMFVGPIAEAVASAVAFNTITTDIILCVTEIAFCGGSNEGTVVSATSLDAGTTAYYVNTGAILGTGQAALTAVAVGETNTAIPTSGGSTSSNVNIAGGSCYSAPNSNSQAYEGVLNYDGDGVLTCYSTTNPGVVLASTPPPDTAGASSSTVQPQSNPISVSCSGAPSNPYINQPVTWSSSVTGGSGSYIYVWTGTDDLWGTTSSVAKSYTTSGVKRASLTITDSGSNRTASASCGTATVSSCTSSFTASPTTVEQGQSINLAWDVSGGSLCASSCSGLGFSTGGIISGSATVLPSPASHSYSLSCSAGTYGPPANENVTVTVHVPTVTISASPMRVPTNTDTTITWSSTNTASCSITRNSAAWRTGLGPTSAADNVTVQTVYRIDCANNYGIHVTDSVIVNIIPIFKAF